MFEIKSWQIFDLQLWANKEPLHKSIYMHVEENANPLNNQKKYKS